MRGAGQPVSDTFCSRARCYRGAVSNRMCAEHAIDEHVNALSSVAADAQLEIDRLRGELDDAEREIANLHSAIAGLESDLDAARSAP